MGNIFYVVWAVLAVSFLLGLRWQAVRNSRRIGAPPAQAITTFPGSMWSPGKKFKGSGDRIRLEFFDWGIRLRAVMVRFFSPVWEARYEELTEARLVAAPTHQGVRLRTGASADEMIFWTRQGSEVLDCLEEHAVPVNRAADHVPDPPRPPTAPPPVIGGS